MTPKRERRPFGRNNNQPEDSQYTSGSDSESTKRKRKGVFKIPRVPSKTPTPQKSKEHEKELFDKDNLIENLRRQLNEQMNSKKTEDSKKPGKELTPAQKKVIEEANSRAQILQPEKTLF